MKGRTLFWIAAAAAAVGIAGLAACLAVAGLNEASAVAGVVVGVVELLALVLGVYGVTRDRREKTGSQAVAGTAAGGSITQVRGVTGSVRISHGAAGPVPARPVTAAPGENPAGDGQSVTDSRVAGHIDQVGDVGGDVTLD